MFSNTMTHVEVYYTPPENIDSTAGILKITGQEAHHVRNVVRHTSGDKAIVVDGGGKAYWVTLSIGPQGIITGTIEKEEPGWGESKTTIGVIIPPLKGHRMDTVIEKGTELGVSSFYIPNTKNAVARVTASKLDRWHRIALAAMKQCCRSVCPTILTFPELEETLTEINKAGADIFYADKGKPALCQMTPNERLLCFARPNGHLWCNNTSQHQDTRVVVAVGPEGGFSDGEITTLNNYGGIPFGLGLRRLRSDTAVIAALAQIIWLSGEDT